MKLQPSAAYYYDPLFFFYFFVTNVSAASIFSAKIS